MADRSEETSLLSGVEEALLVREALFVDVLDCPPERSSMPVFQEHGKYNMIPGSYVEGRETEGPW